MLHNFHHETDHIHAILRILDPTNCNLREPLMTWTKVALNGPIPLGMAANRALIAELHCFGRRKTVLGSKFKIATTNFPIFYPLVTLFICWYPILTLHN